MTSHGYNGSALNPAIFVVRCLEDRYQLAFGDARGVFIRAYERCERPDEAEAAYEQFLKEDCKTLPWAIRREARKYKIRLPRK